MPDNKHINIPKKVDTKNDLDFDFLRREGIKHIEELGSKLWTDYNSHDPGITTLEVLSYAITDLGMRMNLKMEDVLASGKEEEKQHKQFVKGIDILPSAPLTHLDYRKLFIDISGSNDLNRPIKNCWLVPYEETIFTDCRTGNLSFDESNLGDKTSSFNVKGLYKILVDSDEELEECDLANIKSEVLKRYHANRNLCEDLVAIEEIENQDVAVCASIEVERNVDEEYVHARVLHKISRYFAPEVHFYSLNQLLEKGHTTDEIFEGPILDNGFIDTEELRNSQLKTKIRLSDIVKEIMSIDGVKEIKNISMNNCGGSTADSDPWSLCLDPGKKPVLCDLKSFSYSKGTLPLNINSAKVEKYMKEIEEEEALERENAKLHKELVFPEGNYYNIDSYESILNEFPDTYGVGSYGIISKSTPERKALAKQLKGYLLFFDKILASYFKHLGKVKDILSVNGNLTQTYFTQELKGINGFDELVGDGYTKNNDKVLTKTLFEGIDNGVQRRNEVLDHLIGRFAEKFSDYTFVMKDLFGNSVDEIVLRSKESFLADYKEVSKSRGLGYRYWEETEDQLWNTNNVSGTQKRIGRLLGIKNYNRRNVSESPVKIEKNVDGKYTWKIEDKAGDVILESEIDTTFKIKYVALTTMHKAVFNAIQIDSEEVENTFKKPILDEQLIGNIRITVNGSENYQFSIIAEEEVIGVSNIVFESEKTLKEAILALLKYLKHDFTEEGIFLIENLLLKPTTRIPSISLGIGCMEIENTFTVGGNIVDSGDIVSDAFITGCEEACEEEEVIDPYSYRVSIVLPGYSYRFSDPDFRKYAEGIIRQELPAHILAKICWVGDRRSDEEEAKSNLVAFEESYKEFLKHKSSGASKEIIESTKELILNMDQLYNIYPPGRLLDCSLDESDDLNGKIILGQSNI